MFKKAFEQRLATQLLIAPIDSLEASRFIQALALEHLTLLSFFVPARMK